MERYVPPISLEDINKSEPIEIEIDGPTVVVEIGDSNEEFKQNLAESMSEGDLQSLASDLLSDIRTDKNSRRDWEKTVSEGLELLGMKMDERTEPWPGASGVYHSLLSEAVIKFQSEMIMETFPASGPVFTKVIGKKSKEKEEAAERVKADMNWQLTEHMSEYRAEHERMLWNLGFSGAAFKKVYYDPYLERQVSMFVPAEDIYIPYGNTDLASCPRITQRMKKTENEIRRLMQAGFYVERDLTAPAKEISDLDKKKEKLTGINSLDDTRYTLYECHVELDLVGYEDKRDGEESGIALPYVVTLDTNCCVYSLYRNWNPEDDHKKKRNHFVQYTFIPGFGPYGFGYIHILGGYAKGSTSILRQLIDAGTLANLPGGLKTRALRIKGDDTPIAPGEFRDVDVPAGAIRDNIMTLPYKEPSSTLFALFKEVVDEGRGLASTADMKIADMNQQAPVGTTLAIIERMMKVMSAVQARVHSSMKKEFKLLKEIIRDYTPEEYDYETDVGRMVKQSDYEHCDIIPVSDPNASSSTQRMAQYQAALQLSQSAPQLYDLPVLHREALLALGLKNAAEIVPDKDDIKSKDPVSENMNIMNGKPVKAFLEQDHEAHLAVHMSAAQDPAMQKIIGQNPMASVLQQAIQAHLMEHMAFKYRLDIEKQMGVNLPQEDDKLPIEIQNQISRLAAEAAPLVLQMHSAKAAQEAAMAQQKDPTIQAAQQDLQLRQQELQQKGQLAQAELQRKSTKDQMDAAAKADDIRLREEALKAKQDYDGTKLGIEIKKHQAEQESKQELDGVRMGIDIAKSRSQSMQNRNSTQ